MIKKLNVSFKKFSYAILKKLIDLTLFFCLKNNEFKRLFMNYNSLTGKI